MIDPSLVLWLKLRVFKVNSIQLFVGLPSATNLWPARRAGLQQVAYVRTRIVQVHYISKKKRDSTLKATDLVSAQKKFRRGAEKIYNLIRALLP